MLPRFTILTLIVLLLFTACGTNKKVEPQEPEPTALELAKEKSADAMTAYNDKDYAGALEHFNEALKHFNEALPTAAEQDSIPKLIKLTLFNIAKVNIDLAHNSFESNKFDDSIKLFQTALDTYISSESYAIPADSVETNILELYKNIALSATRAGDYLAAIEYYDKYLSKIPSDKEVLNLKFRLYRDYLKDEVSAFKVLQDYATVSNDPSAYLMLGQEYYEKGDNNSAAKNYDKALQLKPDENTTIMVADFYRKIRQYEKSSVIREQYLKNTTNKEFIANTYKYIADNYSLAKNKAKNIEYLEKYLTLEKDALVALAIANHYHGLSNYNKVVQYATITISLEPGNSDAYLLRAIAYYKLNKNKEAKADFTRIQNDPKHGKTATDFLKVLKKY